MPSPEVRGLNGHMDPLFTQINGSNPIGRCKELAGSCRCVTDDSFCEKLFTGELIVSRSLLFVDISILLCNFPLS